MAGPVKLTCGTGLTVTLADDEAVHPFASFTVTV